MSYPVKPSPAYDYETFQAENPASPPPGNELTNDFAGLKAAVDASIDFLTGSFESTGILKVSALPTAQDLTAYTAQSAASAAAAASSATGASTSASAAAVSAAAAAASAATVQLTGTSTTSLAVGTGSKTLTTQTGKSFAVGQFVTVAETAAPTTNYMTGQVTAYNSGTGSLTFTSTAVAGSGTYTDWTISVSGAQGVKGDTGATGSGLSIGGEIFHTGRIADIPSGFLPQNGVAVSRTTYASLFAFWVKSHTFTVTIASPGVVTWTAHGLDDGDPFVPTTSGALPTGLTASTTYYVKAVDANTFQLAAMPGGAAIVTTGSQSGTHTGVSALCGLGDGSTTFNTQDKRGLGNIGNDMMGSTAAGRVTFAGSGIYGRANAQSGGAQTAVAPLKNHNHTSNLAAAGGTALAVPAVTAGEDPTPNPLTVVTSVTAGVGAGTTSTAGDAASGTHNNMSPVFTGIWIVRAS